MSYDIADRKVPVGFHLCNYGLDFEHLKAKAVTIVMDPFYDDGSGHGLWLSSAIKHRKLKEYYLAVQMTDMYDCGAVEDDNDAHYVVEILVVSPASADASTIRSARYQGNGDEVGIELAALMAQNGAAAHVWQACGDDRKQLLDEACKRLTKVASHISRYLGQRQNQAGNIGWDWVLR